ncbi:MAG TPA: hypothetical protein PK359_03260 [Burkholderiaceae bacterium]|nr:hypothetical protein [Burkholderiaceae bacterium]
MTLPVNRLSTRTDLPPSRTATRLATALLLGGLVGLGGCGVMAAPCRLASTVIKMVPVVGHAAALPTDACAAVIDP